MRCSLTLVAALHSVILFAAPKPVGSVSTTGSVLVSGTPVECSVVPSWPVVLGDTIESARTDTAMLSFPDGSRMLLDKQSRVKIEQRGQATALVVAAGSAAFSLSNNSTLRVYANTDMVGGPGSRRSGTASIVRLAERGVKDLQDNLDSWKAPVPESGQSDLSPHTP